MGAEEWDAARSEWKALEAKTVPASAHHTVIPPPHGGVRPFHRKSTCIRQLTSGPYVVQIWSRTTPESGPNESLVLHRVEPILQTLNLRCGKISRLELRPRLPTTQ